MSNSMGYVLAGLLLILILFRRMTLKLTRRKIAWYLDPVALLSGAWLVQSLAYALPIFENRESLEGRHVLYILLCHAAFMAGVLLVPRGPKQTENLDDEPQITWPMLLGVGLIGLMGNLFIAYDGLSTSTVGILERFSGDTLETIRAERFANSAILRGGPFASLEFLASASTVFVCLMTAGVANRLPLTRAQRRFLALAAIGSVVFVAFNALLIMGGRMGLVLLLVGAWLGALMDPKRALFRQIDRALGRAKGGIYTLLLFGVLSSVWFFATTFVKDRLGGTPPLVSLYQYHRAAPTPGVEELIADHETLQYALLSFSYVTVPLTTLVYYYDMPGGQFPGPYWGQYNFSGPVTFTMRRMGMVRDQMTLMDIRTEATRYLRVMGYGDNVWPTLLRDLALDVGWMGVPAIMLLMGWGAELIMRGARQEGNFIAKVLALLTGVLLVFSIAHSLLIIETFQKAFWLCFALLFYRRLSKRFGKKKSPAGTSDAASGTAVIQAHPPKAWTEP